MINVLLEEEYLYLTCEGAKLTARILVGDSVEYELDGMSDQFKEKFANEVGNESILLIEHLIVNEDFRGEGLAGQLLDKLFEVAKEENLMCLYLNASPILAENGLEIESLTSFYERRGFNVLLNQLTNVLMLKKINKGEISLSFIKNIIV